MADTRPNDSSAHSEEVRRRGALVLRSLPILLIPVFVAVITGLLLRATVAVPPPRGERGPASALVPVVVVVVFFSALIVLVRLGRPKISALLLIGAWTLITTISSLRAGVESFIPALLLIPICAAGLLIDGVASVALAALATILVVSAGWLEMQGVTFRREPLSPALQPVEPLLAAGFWIALFWTVAALTSMLAGGVQRALQESRAHAAALQELSDRLEERVEDQTTALLEQSRETATLEERTRLAREIHDTLAQGLTGIVVQLGAAQRALQGAPHAAGEHLELAQRMARESLAEARRSVWNLRSGTLERGTLADALRGLVARPMQPELAGSFTQSGEPWPLPPAIESALLRVAQEALVNVAKHAAATTVAVELAFSPDEVQLTVRDDGVGFDVEGVAETMQPGPWGGFGLLGMRERISALGGELAITNDGGTHVAAVVPRPPGDDGEPGAALTLVTAVEQRA